MITYEEKLHMWASDTVEAIQKNFRTQKIFPYEVYPEYKEINSRQRPSRRSSGAAFDTIYWTVRDMAEGDSFKIDFFFNYYLYYVDMGVGRGQPIEKVDRRRFAQHDQRYAMWRGTGDRQSRPVISGELRYQTERLRRYMQNRYRWESQIRIVHAIEGVVSDKDGNILKSPKP